MNNNTMYAMFCVKCIALIILTGFLCWYFDSCWFVLVLCLLGSFSFQDGETKKHNQTPRGGMSVQDLNYDEKYDILYIKVGDNSNSYGDEQIGDVNIFRDTDTDKITGFMVFGFKRRLKGDFNS